MIETKPKEKTTAKFDLGHIVGTPEAIDAMGSEGLDLLARHAAGDWGELSQWDAELNDTAAESGGRLLSAYTVSSGERVWIITEADRSVTTFLLPSEY